MSRLHAAELGDPPAGRFKAIEIRLGNGWNYYVEYRAEQPAADHRQTDHRPHGLVIPTSPPTASSRRSRGRRSSSCSATSTATAAISARGRTSRRRTPAPRLDLKIEVVSTDDDNAVVNVSYGANGRPEPGIRPWEGGPNWQSPDIEVRNDSADADPGTYFNVPWLGHDNKIVAKVNNSGDLLAKGVVVDFFVTEYTLRRRPVGPARHRHSECDARRASVEFTARGIPAPDEGRHYCVIVRLPLYQDPANPAVIEQNIFDNEARSNYTAVRLRLRVAIDPRGRQVLLANPFKQIDPGLRRCQEDPPAAPGLHRPSMAAGPRPRPAPDPRVGRSPVGHARMGPVARDHDRYLRFCGKSPIG